MRKEERQMACDITAHKMHMCALKAEGCSDEVASLSASPTVKCGNCGALANSPDNVCNPVPLK
ncbi:hypothetical protein GSU3603 [Geobacter sulfurreducens PCA]|uniref:Uncharacterized protein n=2 Tax=Geobacter TaxID=28231 RepID=I7FKF5_GEOSL|nr:hypothetical protein KN400_2589 [Geobacter sulfurreducens KN400]AFP20496.1 hypothetical protein GSU3603 [Geobacter sulfurreducens PCA]HBB68725.1 hypothetical protein [Geobacter sulfurreducens]HCD95815.1 hypothetical protein [Geobacter sulfurreducens]